MLQVDGIDIAEIDSALATALVHLKLRVGIGEGGGAPAVKTESPHPEVTAKGPTWAGVAQVAETKAMVTLRFRDVAGHEMRLLHAS